MATVNINGKSYPTFKIVADIEDAKKIARWGTRGKSGHEPLDWVKLIDCETEHLEAILATQPHIASFEGLREIIEGIIADRKAAAAKAAKRARKKKEPFDPFKL
jgi:hypothetical protein